MVSQYVYKATPRFHFRKKTAWEKKNDLTLKNDLKLEKSFLYCERIKCNRSKSNFATFKCQKGPSIDFDPPRVLVLLLFALWDFYVSCESEVLVILTIPTFLWSLIQNLCLTFWVQKFRLKKYFFSDRTWPTQKLFCRAAEWSLPPWLVCLSDNSIFFVWMQTSRHILRIDDHKNVKVVKMTAKSFSAEMKKQWQKSSRRWVNF